MTIAHMLEASTLREPDALAIVDGTERLSYRELSERVARLAGGLRAMGLGNGDHLVALASNRLLALAQ